MNPDRSKAFRRDPKALRKLRAVLKGKERLILGAQLPDDAVYAWQRQFAALAKTTAPAPVVCNAWGWTRKAKEAEVLLQDQGAGLVLPPLSLPALAELTSPPRPRRVFRALSDLQAYHENWAALVRPPGARLPPAPNPDLLALVAGLSPSAYLRQALPLLRAQTLKIYRPRQGTLALVIGALRTGGAERQIVALALALKNQGFTPVIYLYEPAIEAAHFRQSLKRAGIRCRNVGQTGTDPAALRAALDRAPAEERAFCWHLPAPLVRRTLDLAHAFRRDRPAAVISYLDWQNILGGLAGALAGVPRVLLVGRGSPPTRFPHLYPPEILPVFRDLYRTLLGCEGVGMAHNSRNGAEDYARWLRRPTLAETIIPNGLTDAFGKPVPRSKIAALRRALGLRPAQPVLLGVFRLTREKRPEDFLRVAAGLRLSFPDLHVILVGPEADPQARELAARYGLDAAVTFLGVASDIPALMATASLLLHTSGREGLPNALIEAQAMGLPVVAAASAGALEALSPAGQKRACPLGDIPALTQACASILAHPAQAQKRAQRDRLWALDRFSSDQLATRTLKALGLSS